MNAWFSIPMSIYCVVFELAVCHLTAVFISPLCFVQQIRSSLSSEQNHGLLIATGSWYYLVYWRDSGPWLGLPFNKPVFWDAIARIPSLQDVDINLIRDCNEMLQRDLEKYEEMVPIGQARLTRRAQHGEWENSGVPLLWSLMESMSVDPESWSKYLILVLNHQFWSILAVNLVELCCGPGLDFILIFAESTLDGRCWCWILMGNFEGVYPKFKPKGDDAGLKSGLWRILRSLRHQQRWIGGSSAPISHWVSRTNKITPPMPSRAAGAVKDDVKFDLNKLSKGPPDQPGMAWETEEGEVKCQ